MVFTAETSDCLFIPAARSEAVKKLCQILLASLVLFQSASAVASPEAEIMHWWSRGGDYAALQVFRAEFEGRGGIWHDTITEGSIETLNNAVSRMSKGYAPTFVLWNSGWEVTEISRLGLLDPITDSVTLNKIRGSILDSVLGIVSVDEQIVAIPVNVHSENWLWHLRDAVEPGDAELFGTWQQFLAFAKQKKEADEIVIAVGDEPWQQRLLFNNVLLGVAGQSLYQAFYTRRDINALEDPAFAEALDVFRQLKAFSRSFKEGRWDQQIAAVADGRALTISMGDWAKGEFQNLGIDIGSKLACVPAPGTANKLILVIDVFVRGRVDNKEEGEGQSHFIDIVTDPAVNQRFNSLKGSLPPLKHLDQSTLDDCGRIAYTALQQQTQVIEPFANYGHREALSKIEYLIGKLWNQETDVAQTIKALRALMEVNYTYSNNKQ